MLNLLATKVQWATDHKIASRVITQFCFDNLVITEYLSQLRRLVTTSDVYIGLAGPMSMTQLIKFSLLCGIGNSIQFLKDSSSLRGLIGGIVGHYDSNAFIHTLQESEQLIDGYHFFTFGNYLKAFESRQEF